MGLVNKIGECAQDNLISRLFPPAETTGIVIEKLDAEATLKRGTLLGVKDGKYAIYGGESTAKTAKFSGNGTEKNFTVIDKPETVTVTVDGTATTAFSYSSATGLLSFTTAPAQGTDNIVVSYSLSSGYTPSAILAEDVNVGTEADVTAVAYRSGNFNPDAVIVADGYTLTEADLDALRKYDIIFTQMI